MILVDLFCPKCDKRYIDVFIDTKEELPECDICQSRLKKLVHNIHYKLIYNNRTDMVDWDGNSSQYWKDIKDKGGEEPLNDRQAKWE